MGWPAPREVFEVGCRRWPASGWRAAPVAVECAQFRPRATVLLVATGSTIANHPAGRLTADELANLIPAVERYAEVETEQFANLPNSSLTVEGSVGCVRVAIVLRLLRWVGT